MKPAEETLSNPLYVAYYRVSTQKQGTSGLGLEAQQESVKRYLSNTGGRLLAEFTEVETGKGADPLSRRPRLRDSLGLCQAQRSVLLIAKLDRLARNVRFIAELMESRVKFIACDMPEANDLTIHIMAAFAEHEAKRISERTKEALARAKARGVQLGITGRTNLKPNIQARRAAARAFANGFRGQVEGFRLRGLSQRDMVRELNSLGIKASKGGSWSLRQLQRVLLVVSTSDRR
jgi:DNA invertase Pin-like site-specific DNA recombinase